MDIIQALKPVLASNIIQSNVHKNDKVIHHLLTTIHRAQAFVSLKKGQAVMCWWKCTCIKYFIMLLPSLCSVMSYVVWQVFHYVRCMCAWCWVPGLRTGSRQQLLYQLLPAGSIYSLNMARLWQAAREISGITLNQALPSIPAKTSSNANTYFVLKDC